MPHHHSAHSPHSHTHAVPPPLAHPGLPARLFAAGAAQRLLLALVPLALVWLMTWWAL